MRLGERPGVKAGAEKVWRVVGVKRVAVDSRGAGDGDEQGEKA